MASHLGQEMGNLTSFGKFQTYLHFWQIASAGRYLAAATFFSAHILEQKWSELIVSLMQTNSVPRTFPHTLQDSPFLRVFKQLEQKWLIESPLNRHLGYRNQT